MYRFTYDDGHTATERYRNMLDAARSMLDAMEGGHPAGRRASADGRFTVQASRMGGYDRMGHHQAHYVAGYGFDVYEGGVVDAAYPLTARMRTSRGEMELQEVVVFMYVMERYGVDLLEHVDGVLGELRALPMAA